MSLWLVAAEVELLSERWTPNEAVHVTDVIAALFCSNERNGAPESGTGSINVV